MSVAVWNTNRYRLQVLSARGLLYVCIKVYRMTVHLQWLLTTIINLIARRTVYCIMYIQFYPQHEAERKVTMHKCKWRNVRLKRAHHRFKWRSILTYISTRVKRKTTSRACLHDRLVVRAPFGIWNTVGFSRHLLYADVDACAIESRWACGVGVCVSYETREDSTFQASRRRSVLARFKSTTHNVYGQMHK